MTTISPPPPPVEEKEQEVTDSQVLAWVVAHCYIEHHTTGVFSQMTPLLTISAIKAAMAAQRSEGKS